jgi:hypothetical protein
MEPMQGALPSPSPTPISMSLPHSEEPSTEDFRDFRDYVEKTKSYSGVGYEEAKTFVKEGDLFLKRLRSGELKEVTQEKRRIFIIPWTWFLVSKACEKREGFFQGMIVFEDPKHEVANFFSPAASSRLSSHYPGRVEGENFGIDELHKLPYGFHTVLFGKLKVPDGEGDWTFWKPENFGIESPCEFVFHAIDYCNFKFLKTCNIGFGAFGRDEHLKGKFVEDGLRMQSAGFPVSCHTVEEWGSAGVFPTILPYLKSPESAHSLSADQKMTLFHYLQSIRSHDWIHIRSGKEVVISEKADPYKEGKLALFTLLQKDFSGFQKS